MAPAARYDDDRRAGLCAVPARARPREDTAVELHVARAAAGARSPATTVPVCAVSARRL